MELLSFQGLCHIVGVPQNTAKYWMEEFSMYIPKTQQDEDIYYLTEAIDIMRFIKKSKYQNATTPWITRQLAGRSFPIRVDNPQMEQEQCKDCEHDFGNLVAFMQNIGTTISHVAAHEKMLQDIKKKQLIHEAYFHTIEHQQSEIAKLKQEIGMLQKQISHTKDYKRKKQQMADLFQ